MESPESDSELAESGNLRKPQKVPQKVTLEASSDKAERVFNFLCSNRSEKVTQSKIVDRTELSEWKARKGLEELRSKGLIEKLGSKRSTRYELSEAGEIVLRNTPTSYLRKPQKVEDNQDSRGREIDGRVDNISYRLKFSEDCFITDSNREVVLSELGDGWDFDQDNEQYYLDRKSFHVRLTGERAIVYLREEFKGLSVELLKDDAISEIVEIKNFLEDDCGLRFKDRGLLMGKLNTQDVAIENHPLVVAVLEYTDQKPHEIDPVKDSDGRVRLFLDHSGDGDLEASNVGYPSGSREFCEDDIDHEISRLAWQSENKDAELALRALAEEISDVLGVQELRDGLVNRVGSPAREDSSEVGDSFTHTEGLGFSMDVEASSCEAQRVNFSRVSMGLSTISEVTRNVSEREESDKAESWKNRVMTVSENSKDLDIRNLPDTLLEDDQGNRMVVHHIDDVDVSEASEGSESPTVVLSRDSERLEVDLEDLKNWIVEGDVEVVEG